jgi:hypothetical protein
MTPLRLAQERNWLIFRLNSVKATYQSIQHWCDGSVVITADGIDQVERAIDVAYQKKLADLRASMLRSGSFNP